MRKFAVVVAGLLGAALAFEAAASDAWVARAKRVVGDVQVEQNGQVQPLRVGDRLPTNAVIVTGSRSGAGLTFRDNSRASVGPNARLALADYAFEPGQQNSDARLETRLETGAAAFVSGRVTKRKPGAMKVKTPAALLGVRGTTFVAVTGAPLDQ